MAAPPEPDEPDDTTSHQTPDELDDTRRTDTLGESESEMLDPSPSSHPGSAPLQFGIGGRITVWDPIHRHLEIGARTFWVTPGVSVDRLAVGGLVTVIGHVDHPDTSGARWIVTHLTRA